MLEFVFTRTWALKIPLQLRNTNASNKAKCYCVQIPKVNWIHGSMEFNISNTALMLYLKNRVKQKKLVT